MNVYDFKAVNGKGQEVSLSDYKGKVLLIVNTASKCGFTPQFEGLEKLYNAYKDRGFVVLGFPCNQFAEQDPGSDGEIQEFCRLNYGVRGKRYFAIGFPNVAGGYEIRSRYFKGCVPPKDVSLIKPKDTASDVCSVFEGFMDFLSAAALGIGGNSDSLVLNSVANVGKAVKHLDGYGRIDCFLDRDEAGRRTLEALKGYYGGRVTDRSALHDGYKDLNEYLQLTAKNEQ